MTKRPWDHCPGSNTRPPGKDITQARAGLFGRCPHCLRWVRLTKRTQALSYHAPRAPKSEGKPTHE